ncbi:hypothetical protein [Terricaulis sp.]|uniref:hypothetical protein n=1 Tax=Terricaulis sp. TaxID=2768686 RepID=UPI002AC42399|nr:hypothetical protein [Terricaulis sp.]MDZ4691027.1 hypothetical protein [Terricaulis sp.]
MGKTIDALEGAQVGEARARSADQAAIFCESVAAVQKEFAIGRSLRVASGALTASISLIWLPGVFPVFSLGAILLHEFVFFPLGLKHLVVAQAARRPLAAQRAYAAMLFTGGFVYALVWLPTLMLGGSSVDTWLPLGSGARSFTTWSIFRATECRLLQRLRRT